MRTPRGTWPLIVGAVAAAALFAVAPAAGAASKPPAKKTGAATSAATRPPTPTSLLPASGVTLDRMPVFTWTGAKTADHYEFQVAADKGFNSTLAGNDGKQSTKNTAATIATALGNGMYWWRVRSVSAQKKTSEWTKGRSVVLTWAPILNVTGPANGTPFSNPAPDPSGALVLRWAAMPGAAQYAVSIATDPLLGSLLTADGVPQLVDGTAFTPGGSLADGTYYWSVTPIDPEGHKGVPSPVRSFVVHWNATIPALAEADIASSDALMAPRFTWGRVAGAASYEIEISTSVDFAAISKVCCTLRTTGTSYGPTSLLGDDTYYWRVRPFDGAGNAGPWSVGTPFTKSFDDAGVTGLKVRDMADIGETDTTTNGTVTTSTPVVTWDPVIGAAAYQVEVDEYRNGACDPDLTLGTFTTGVPSWTPLGSVTVVPPALPNSPSVSQDDDIMSDGVGYCVQVRAVDTDTANAIEGPWTAINGFLRPAFTYVAAVTPANAQCNADLTTHTRGYLCANDFVSPAAGVHVADTPSLFLWKPVANAAGYYVVVARDAAFHSILDFAFTNVTAYAPRFGVDPYLYPDETAGSPLYWAVIPTTNSDGSGYAPATSLATLSSPRPFDKQSVAPTVSGLTVDSNGVTVVWAPMMGAAFYDFQVATDAAFANIIDGVTTDSPSYTALSSFPAAQTYYYRVRADDAYGDGLAWANGTFSMPLAAPVPSPPAGDINAPALDGIPTWSWSAVPGALSYDVHVDYPNGTFDDTPSIRSIVATSIKLNGSGVWNWRVRAEFPKTDGSTVPGPWSASQPFTRTFGEPVGGRVVDIPGRLIFSWEPKQGAKTYHLQVSSDPDFQDVVEDITQDGTRYAPTLVDTGYVTGGRLYWHVAAVDAESNQGDWSATSNVLLARGMKLAVGDAPHKGKAKMVRVKVTTVAGGAVPGVTVRVVGAGTVQRARKTDKKGVVMLLVHPTSAGSLTFRATKAGYQLATFTDVVS